jgi:hypothetical protein
VDVIEFEASIAACIDNILESLDEWGNVVVGVQLLRIVYKHWHC